MDIFLESRIQRLAELIKELAEPNKDINNILLNKMTLNRIIQPLYTKNVGVYEWTPYLQFIDNQYVLNKSIDTISSILIQNSTSATTTVQLVRQDNSILKKWVILSNETLVSELFTIDFFIHAIPYEKILLIIDNPDTKVKLRIGMLNNDKRQKLMSTVGITYIGDDQRWYQSDGILKYIHN